MSRSLGITPPLTTDFFARDPRTGKPVGISVPWIMYLQKLDRGADVAFDLQAAQSMFSAGTPPATGIEPFTDGFGRANLFSTGKWIGSRGNASTIATGIDTNRFSCGNTGVSAAQAGGGYCVATPDLFPNASQYMKMTYKAYSGGSPRGGPGLYFNGEMDAAGGYFIFLVPDLATVHLGSKLSQGGGYVGVLSADICVLAANDVFELQVDIEAGQNTLNVWQNGTQIVTDYADSAGGRPSTGWPCVFNANCSGIFYLDDYELRDVR